MSEPNDEGTEQGAVQRRINPGQLRELGSFADALRLAEEQYGTVEAASAAIGDGFALLTTEQKQQLVGVPCIFLSWSFSPSEQGERGEFVTVRVVTEDGRKLVLNDGSSGVYSQLREYTDESGRDGGLIVKRGLRKSDYTYTETEGKDKGKQKPATTYYIDTAA